MQYYILLLCNIIFISILMIFHVIIKEGNGTPLQYCCLENPMDGGTWWATVHAFMHWRRKWQPTPVFLPGESQGQGSLGAAIYGVAQSRT